MNEGREPDLLQQSQLVSYALAVNHVGVFTQDHRSGKLLLCAEAQRLLGVVDGSLDMQGLLRLVHEEDRGPLIERMATAHRQRDESREYQVEFRVGQVDAPRWIRLRARVERNEDGVVVAERGCVRDVSREHDLAEALVFTQRRQDVGRLTGAIAHDFNNFLTSMLAEASLAGMCDDLPLEVVESLRAIETAAERASVLTRQLLNYSGTRAGSQRPVRLDHAFDQAERFLYRILPETIELRFEGADVDWPVRLDLTQFQQLLMTLIMGAAPEHAEDNRVVVRVQRAAGEAVSRAGLNLGDYVQIEVLADTGPCDAVRKPSREGARRGELGLVSCEAIAEELGGGVELASGAGAGQAVRVFLPILSPETWHELSRTSAPPSATEPSAARVLVVEDDAAVRDLITRSLEAFGFDTLGVANSDALLESVSRERFDLVLSDVVLPGKPMREVRRELAARQPELAVLFMSGYPEPEAVGARGETFVDGGDGFIQKPFTVPAIVQKIRQVLARR